MSLPQRRYEDCCGAHKKFSPLCDECIYFRALEREHAALTAVAEAAKDHRHHACTMPHLALDTALAALAALRVNTSVSQRPEGGT